MNYKIVKIDGRYAGHEYFKYRVEFPRGISQVSAWRYHHYQELRDWLWENHGASCERDLYCTLYYSPWVEGEDMDPPRNGPKWAWHYDTTDNQPLLYVADDATLAHLQLKWGT